MTLKEFCEVYDKTSTIQLQLITKMYPESEKGKTLKININPEGILAGMVSEVINGTVVSIVPHSIYNVSVTVAEEGVDLTSEAAGKKKDGILTSNGFTDVK